MTIRERATFEAPPSDNLMEHQIRDGQSRLVDLFSAFSGLYSVKMVLTAVRIGLAPAMVTSLPGPRIR